MPTARHQRAIQSQFLRGSQLAKRPFRDITKLQRTNRYSHQPQDLDTACFQHPANLPVLPFIERDLKPAVLLARTQDCRLRCPEDVSVLHLHAAHNRLDQSFVHNCADLHVISLFEMGFRSCNPRSPFRIVRQEQKTLAGLIKPADRRHPRKNLIRSLKNGINRLAPFLVRCRSNQPPRLIHDEINLCLTFEHSPLDINPISPQNDRRFRIASQGPIQAHVALANQNTGLGARAISQLRQRSRQPDFPLACLSHRSMLTECRITQRTSKLIRYLLATNERSPSWPTSTLRAFSRLLMTPARASVKRT